MKIIRTFTYEEFEKKSDLFAEMVFEGVPETEDFTPEQMKVLRKSIQSAFQAGFVAAAEMVHADYDLELVRQQARALVFKELSKNN